MSKVTLSAARFSDETPNDCVGGEMLQLLQETFAKALLSAAAAAAVHA